MQNYSEQIKQATVAGTNYSESTVVSGVGSLKIKDEKVYDTSSSADAFSSLSAGDIIKMEGWPNYGAENNRIFTVTKVDSDGEWIKVDKELKDVPESDVSSVTIYKSPASLSVSDVTANDVVTAVAIMDTTSSSVSNPSADDFAITSEGTVSHFDTNIATEDVLLVTWADLSLG